MSGALVCAGDRRVRAGVPVGGEQTAVLYLDSAGARQASRAGRPGASAGVLLCEPDTLPAAPEVLL